MDAFLHLLGTYSTKEKKKEFCRVKFWGVNPGFTPQNPGGRTRLVTMEEKHGRHTGTTARPMAHRRTARLSGGPEGASPSLQQKRPLPTTPEGEYRMARPVLGAAGFMTKKG
jgi:hypothetical protein